MLAKKVEAKTSNSIGLDTPRLIYSSGFAYRLQLQERISLVSLRSLFPTADELLAVSTEDLAPILLRLAQEHMQGAGFWPDGIINEDALKRDQSGYPFHKKAQVEQHVNETWECLKRDGLIGPSPGMDGRNGWMTITKDGQAALKGGNAIAYVRATRSFSKALLHPSIADPVWSALMRGDLDDAVFKAFKAVEVAVREAAQLAATDIGVDLMRKAFDPEKGRLARATHPTAERQALSHLFAGAIGSYKNPHSHRTVNLTDPREAWEQVMLATHLLGIVDTRRGP
ncbi:TIGR02391 family protein [Bradyrhizobium sp. SRS-191]|uniref:TIGR02391 family protein n=1 Tax=Bradyrhizobium sp. SRS-191 TaxID=2962606 RepID=UPI00211E21F6|nr:TIGR02391 family protein [Bradyrhizobium sp. SRS-191]